MANARGMFCLTCCKHKRGIDPDIYPESSVQVCERRLDLVIGRPITHNDTTIVANIAPDEIVGVHLFTWLTRVISITYY